MLRVLAERILWGVATVWCAVTAAFFVLRLIPGDPVDIRLGPLAAVTDEQRAALRTELGLDQSVWVQYLGYLKALLTGDFGYSYQQHLEVSAILARGTLPTLQLTALACLFALLFVVLGLAFSRIGRSWGRTPLTRTQEAITEALHLLAVSVPTYWIGATLMLVFAFGLGWFPATGTSGFDSLVLPALALSIPVAGIVGRTLGTELDRAESADFGFASRLRGMSPLRFAWFHGLRHAAAPLAALITTVVGGLFAGAVLVETVFARAGLGAITLQAVLARDMPVILALVALSACVFAVLGVLADLLVWVADPRTRGGAVLR